MDIIESGAKPNGVIWRKFHARPDVREDIVDSGRIKNRGREYYLLQRV